MNGSRQTSFQPSPFQQAIEPIVNITSLPAKPALQGILGQ